MDKRHRDITGEKRNRLTAIRASHLVGSKWHWVFKCDCGNEHIACRGNFVTGLMKSCGCLSREALVKRNFRHGMRKHPAYKMWCKIKSRCGNPHDREFHNYGARGIVICERWMVFQNFWDDIGFQWKRGLTLDRRDNSRGYEPGNCRWTTDKVQSNNTRHNRFESGFGEKKTVMEWHNVLSINYRTLLNRLNAGYSIEEISQWTHERQRPYVDRALRQHRIDARRKILQQFREEQIEHRRIQETLCGSRKSRNPR